MRTKLLTVCLVFAALSALGTLTGSTTFYKIDIKKDIGSTTWIYTQRVLKRLQKNRLMPF